MKTINLLRILCIGVLLIFCFCKNTDKGTKLPEPATVPETESDSNKSETPEWVKDVDDIDPWDLMDPQ